MRQSEIRNPKSKIRNPAARGGFTLVEILTATTLTLIMMASVITIFGNIGTRVSDSRSGMEMAEKLRATAAQLQQDLAGVTVTMAPPRSPESNEGYFEYIEGPRGAWGLEGRTSYKLKDSNNNLVHFLTAVRPDPTNPTYNIADISNTAPKMPFDSTVIDNDDILMFTTRSLGKPFTGRFGLDANGNILTVESPVAEVAWFVRGHTLYRRVLLVLPAANSSTAGYITGSMSTANPPAGAAPTQQNYYDLYDVSARWVTTGGSGHPVANTLGDLTKRENRYAHCATSTIATGSTTPTVNGTFPFDVRANWAELGLPTLAECSIKKAAGGNWTNPTYLCQWNIGMSTGVGSIASGVDVLDYWDSFETAKAPLPQFANPSTTKSGGKACMVPSGGNYNPATDLNPPDPSSIRARWTDDVIMTNVIGFDVKVWDPGAPVITRTVTSSAGGTSTPQTLVLTPGDPGYFAAGTGQTMGVAPNGTVIGYGAYVDLGYPLSTTYYPTLPSGGTALSIPRPQFNGAMAVNMNVNLPTGYPSTTSITNNRTFLTESSTTAGWARGRVYDIWSTHYSRGGVIDSPSSGSPMKTTGTGCNGFDDNTTGNQDNGMVDDPEEIEVPPPYSAPLRAIQVKIRAFDPGSRQVREMTVEQDFLPE